MKLEFPRGFLWGAATSAHQIEGGQYNSWTEWEKSNAERLAHEAKVEWLLWQQEKFPEMFDPQNYISGRACDHYNLYEKDFDLAKDLGHNVHRFSIEWSRIEPEEGKFDEREIEHYRQVIRALKARGMEPFVTLWHWTNPVWLEAKGGCEGAKFPFYFARYAKKLAEAYNGEFKFWITLNEPTSVIGMGYVRGKWPPQKTSWLCAWKMYHIFARAHCQAYEAIHAADPAAQVGFANILHSFESYRKDSWMDRLMVRLGRYISNHRMLNLTRGYNDFLTVQYYFHNRFKFPKNVRHPGEIVSDLNWEIFPHGLYRILKHLWHDKLPIYITENGLADRDDVLRKQFIIDHLREIHQAITEGVDVRGYFHWSLLDNFEWDKGYWPRFGLIAVDYKTLERKVRPSALEYAKICRANAVEIN